MGVAPSILVKREPNNMGNHKIIVYQRAARKQRTAAS